MDSAQAEHSSINARPSLSAHQEKLLLAALNSNNNQNKHRDHHHHLDASILSSKTMAPGAVTESSLQTLASGTTHAFEESPFVDYDYDFEGDGSFDLGDFKNEAQGQMIGNLPGTSPEGGDNDSHDKRSHPDDEGDKEEGGGKRRENDEKTSKKPGRKPITSEPTSKRKAQNRAAQRAFRERKEKHLKDLETKVEDLEKASESANHENSILRAQIEKMSIELREYRKRLSLNGATNRTPSLGNGLPPYLANGFASPGLSNPSDVNFQFEFPTFGRLPGPSTISNADGTRNSTSPPVASEQTSSPVEIARVSPRNQTLQYTASNGRSDGMTEVSAQLDGSDMSSLSGLFSPSLLESVGKDPLFDYSAHKTNVSNGPRSSTDSANGNISTGHNTSYSSPSASSNSNHGPSSSCGTSPEPTMQSPVFNKTVDSSLTTIGEEQTANVQGSGGFDAAAFNLNGIDWFAQQNNNQFDPQLFGDYREPQDNVLSNETFGDAFFTDAFTLGEFNNSFNVVPSPVPPKKDLVAQIDAQQNGDEDSTQLLSCNTIWDRLQACPKIKDGEFDLDLLCKDLQKKAKCSETGAGVKESDFNKIMQSHVTQSRKETQT